MAKAHERTPVSDYPTDEHDYHQDGQPTPEYPFGQQLAPVTHIGGFGDQVFGGEQQPTEHDPARSEAPSMSIPAPAKSTSSKSSGSGAGGNRQLVRRAAEKTEELLKAPTDLIELSAVLLGANPTVPDLVVALFAGSKGQGQVADDVRDLIDADLSTAGVVVITAGRSRIRAMWKVIAQLGLLNQTVPDSDSKAAIGLVKAIYENPAAEHARHQLGRAFELIGR